MSGPATKPKFITTRVLAKALGVSRHAVLEYIYAGWLPGARRLQVVRPWHDEQCVTRDGRWKIPIDALSSLLTRLYAGDTVPRGVARALRKVRPTIEAERLVRARAR